MARRTERSSRRAEAAPAEPVGRQPRHNIVHTSLYLPRSLHDALREAAFKERVKIYDLVLEGIGLALRARGKLLETAHRGGAEAKRAMKVGLPPVSAFFRFLDRSYAKCGAVLIPSYLS